MSTSIAEFMEQDHDRLDEIFKRFQETKRQDPAKGKTLFKDFLTGLHRHIVWEEEILFPIFEQQAEMMQGQGPTRVMRMEHRQIKQFLDQIHEKVAAGDPNSDEAERGLLEVLGAHNVKEERILYPWIDSMVSGEERAALITRMQHLPPEAYTQCCS
ncbi:MAG: hemerythrin domain-containing protein [Nitrospirae bacterium]|nr:MAG: hemerythrin domain-containing protein [Nitrospirota bacterium]